MFDTETTEIVVHGNSKLSEGRTKNDQIEYAKSVEAASKWIGLQLEKKQQCSEKILLNPDQSFNVPRDVTELPPNIANLVRYAHRMEMSENGLHKLCEDISFKNQELRFSFKRDLQGKWVEYSATRLILKTGDKVVWKSQDVDQWDQPKIITSISEDPGSKRKFAFFGNSKTGIPLEQLFPQN